MSLLINNCFKQVRDHLRETDAGGPSAVGLLLLLMRTHFVHGDQSRAFEKLQAFGGPTSTMYSIFLRALGDLTSVVQGSENVFKRSVAMVLEVVRTSVSRQFPALTPVLYPGETMSAVEPFPSVSAMWQAHELYATKNTPAVNSEKYF